MAMYFPHRYTNKLRLYSLETISGGRRGLALRGGNEISISDPNLNMDFDSASLQATHENP